MDFEKVNEKIESLKEFWKKVENIGKILALISLVLGVMTLVIGLVMDYGGDISNKLMSIISAFSYLLFSILIAILGFLVFIYILIPIVFGIIPNIIVFPIELYFKHKFNNFIKKEISYDILNEKANELMKEFSKITIFGKTIVTKFRKINYEVKEVGPYSGLNITIKKDLFHQEEVLLCKLSSSNPFNICNTNINEEKVNQISRKSNEIHFFNYVFSKLEHMGWQKIILKSDFYNDDKQSLIKSCIFKDDFIIIYDIIFSSEN